MKFLLPSILFIFSGLGFSQTVTLSSLKKGKLIYQEIDLSKFSVENLELKHPDDVYKDRPLQKWSGVSLGQILKTAKIKPKDSDEVTIIGSDKYLAEFKFTDLKTKNPIFAYLLDGQKISEKKGGIHTVFPNGSKYSNTSAVWVWNVKSIHVGATTPFINLTTKDVTKNIDASSLKGKKDTKNAIVAHPPGKHLNDHDEFRLDLSKASLKEILNSPTNGVSIETIFETKTLSQVEIQDYFIIFGTKTPIPRHLGGPIQLCKENDIKSCLFFADKISIKNN